MNLIYLLHFINYLLNIIGPHISTIFFTIQHQQQKATGNQTFESSINNYQQCDNCGVI